MLKLKKFGNKYMKDTSEQFDKIIDDPDFNIEEKLFLNRLAFLCFKNDINATFDDYLKLCTILVDGMFEQKIKLLIDLIDEDNDG